MTGTRPGGNPHGPSDPHEPSTPHGPSDSHVLSDSHGSSDSHVPTDASGPPGPPDLYDFLEPPGPIGPPDSYDPLETSGPLAPLGPVETSGPLGPLAPLGPLETSGPLGPRRVAFDWRSTPLHWIPGEPLATHVINVLHLLLPAGERWFVQVFKEALPRVSDPDLLARVKGFMGQEATHSVQHSSVLDHLAAQHLDTADFTRRVDRLFDRLLGAVPPWWVPLPKSRWILYRLAFVAAIEQFTAVLGDWVLAADGLDRAGADPVMLGLLRWHGAEEVEHRCVAFDMYEHCGGPGPLRRLRRTGTMCVTAPVLLWLWIRGTGHLIGNDPTIAPGQSTYSVSGHNRAIAKGLLPTWRSLGAAVPRYLRRTFHPSQEGSRAAALAYLARMPVSHGLLSAPQPPSEGDGLSKHPVRGGP